jgi:hypothetical protein
MPGRFPENKVAGPGEQTRKRERVVCGALPNRIFFFLLRPGILIPEPVFIWYERQRIHWDHIPCRESSCYRWWHPFADHLRQARHLVPAPHNTAILTG